MKKAISHLFLLLIICFVLLMTTETNAVTYKYTGNLFTQTSGEGDPSLLGNSIQITVKTSSPLTNGGYGLDSNLYTFISMTDGITTFNWTKYSPSSIGIGNLIVSDGVITQWGFYAHNDTNYLYSAIDQDWSMYRPTGQPSYEIWKLTDPTVFPPGTWAMVSDLSIDNPYVYTTNWGDSGGVLPSGHFFILGAFVSPAGPYITARAHQFPNLEISIALTYSPTPLHPNDYHHIRAFDSIYDGRWMIIATHFDDEAERETSKLDDPRLLPLAETFTVSGSTGALTPTLSWTGFDSGQYPGFSGTPVDGSDNFTLRVGLRNMEGKLLMQSSDYSTSVTSITVPANVLAQGQDYLLEIMLNHYDYESGAWYLENRSETFLQHSTPIITCIGDFDLDGVVDGSDLVILTANPFLMDLASFAQKFGKSCM